MEGAGLEENVSIESLLDEMKAYSDRRKNILPPKNLSRFWWDDNDTDVNEKAMERMYACSIKIRDWASSARSDKDHAIIKELIKIHNRLFKKFYDYHNAVLNYFSAKGLLICDIIIESVANLIIENEKFKDSNALIYSTNKKYLKTCVARGADANASKKYIVKGRAITPIELLYREYAACQWMLRDSIILCRKPPGKIDASYDFYYTFDIPACRSFLQARVNQFPEKIKILLDAGADINTRLDSETLLFKDIPIDVVKFLLESGADVNIKNDKGQTAFFKNSVARSLLVEYGSNINEKDNDGRNVLTYVGNEELLVDMIASGADVNALDIYGRTPIFYHDLKEFIEPLVEAGADIHIVDNEGRTPIFYAQWASGINCLCRMGLDINAVDIYGRTFIFANMLLSGEFKKILKRYRSSVNLNHKDKDGRTAIYYLEGYRIDDLLEYDIDLTVEDNNGCTPLMYWMSREDSKSKQISRKIKKAVGKLKKKKNPKDEVFFVKKISPTKNIKPEKDTTSPYVINEGDREIISAAIKFCEWILKHPETAYMGEQIKKVIGVLKGLPKPAPKELRINCTLFLFDESGEECASLDVAIHRCNIYICQIPHTDSAKKKIASQEWSIEPGAASTIDSKITPEFIESLKMPESLIKLGFSIDPGVAY